jgi:hypothetical protein
MGETRDEQTQGLAARVSGVGHFGRSRRWKSSLLDPRAEDGHTLPR